MSTAKAITCGCIAIVLTGLAALGAFGIFIFYVAQEPEGVRISADGPTEVRVGETFDLTITVTNERTDEDVELSDIDIADEYIDGFTVASIEPKPDSSMHIPIDNSWSFTFDDGIAPQTTVTYIFKLRAEKPGLHRGDVDVCEGVRFITAMAQTVVKE